jgi:four helix bundle suffix protein
MAALTSLTGLTMLTLGACCAAPILFSKPPMPELFDKHGGFRRLHTFTLATIVQLETLQFCRRFLTFDHRETDKKFYDPKGRQYDQMAQAARSGRQNIIEGSERSSTSKDTEMKLTDVARASLSELRGDYEIFILDRGHLPWSVHSAEARTVNAISLDAAPFTDDMVHESARHVLEQRTKYDRWLDAEDPVVVANAMLIIIGRVLNMLKGQIEAQGKAFAEAGGFSERLTARRLEARQGQKNAEPPPSCPQCQKPMRRRQSAKGDFWGCSVYPACKGILSV